MYAIKNKEGFFFLYNLFHLLSELAACGAADANGDMSMEHVMHIYIFLLI